MISALLASGAATDSLSLTTAPEQHLRAAPTPEGSTRLVKSNHRGFVRLDVLSDGLALEASERGLTESAENEIFDGFKSTSSVVFVDGGKFDDNGDVYAKPGEWTLRHADTIQHSARYGKGSANCASARKGLRWYRGRYAYWAGRLSGAAKPLAELIGVTSCPRARYLAKITRAKAYAARRAYERSRTLRDFPIRPGNRAWLRAVEQAQRPYPGSRSWLLSCSAAEGGWGRWVIHGGASYYPGVENVGTSSGHLQYRYSTFKGHYRRALDDLRARGFKVPKHLRSVSVTAWRSALGQALAGGWGILHGQRSHWSASFGRGC